MIIGVSLSCIEHLSHEILKYSVSYSWTNGHLSSGITTSWPANQSVAKLSEGGVYATYPDAATLSKLYQQNRPEDWQHETWDKHQEHVV